MICLLLRVTWPSVVNMTAIVSIYIPDGFVIGADGRRMIADGTEIATEFAQKIFTVEDADLRLAYAWTGLTEFQTSDRRYFDFKFASNLILSQPQGIANFSALVSQFTAKLNALLRLYIGIPKIGALTGVLFVGYFRGKPCQAEVLWGGSEFMVASLSEPVSPNRQIFSGSENAFKKHKQSQFSPDDLLGAIQWIRQYLVDCVNDEGSPGIGGHIHIGKLTAESFSWVDPPVKQ